jgi:sulfur carrier protein ThiS
MRRYSTRRRFAALVPVLAAAALLLPATALAQATRTWVSGVGDDANPCSRTAPCKTFAGAISKTAAGGIINVIDDGGFGALTITKAITVDGHYHLAGMLASGGINAVNVAAGVNDKVVLRGLDIEGNGTTLGLNGVRITQARSVRIEDSYIHDFSRSGVSFEPNNANSKLVVVNSSIHNNGGNGVNIVPQLSGGGAKATITGNSITDNACGIVASSFGMDSGFVFSNACATAGNTTGINSSTDVTAIDNWISFNSLAGVVSRGGVAVVRIGRNQVTSNAFGLLLFGAGPQIISLGGNMVNGNPSGDGAPTSTILPI